MTRVLCYPQIYNHRVRDEIIQLIHLSMVVGYGIGDLFLTHKKLKTAGALQQLDILYSMIA